MGTRAPGAHHARWQSFLTRVAVRPGGDDQFSEPTPLAGMAEHQGNGAHQNKAEAVEKIEIKS